VSNHMHFPMQRVTAMPRCSAHIPRVAKEEADAPTDDSLPEIQQVDLLPRRTVSNQKDRTIPVAAKQ
jgi:hypothetical protein